MGNDGFTGYELWKYDGQNISQVADLNPGVNSSLPEPMSAFNNSYMFVANNGTTGTELWRLDAFSDDYGVTGVTRQGNDERVSWVSPGGWTNVLQGMYGVGGTNHFSDVSPAIPAASGGIVSTNYLDIGGAAYASRLYRLRTGP